MTPNGTEEVTRDSDRPFELGCGQIVLGILVVLVLLGIRLGQLDRESAAVETIRELGGSVIFGAETNTVEWLEPLVPPRVVLAKLEDTQATNEEVRSLRALGHLEWLHLSRTRITSGSLAPLAGLSKLRLLALEETAIGDEDLRYVAGLENLRTLRLSGTRVTDAGLRRLEGLVRLEVLSLGDTGVTAEGLATLPTFESLFDLEIDESQVTAASVEHLRRIRGLQRIAVRVRRGTGRHVRDLLATLTGVQARGFRRVRPGEADTWLRPCDGILWNLDAPWESTTGGITETVLAKVRLEPEALERLLDVFAVMRPGGGWQTLDKPPARAKRAARKLARGPIRGPTEFLQVLRTGTDQDFARALAYATTREGRSALPTLLPLLKAKDFRLRHRAAAILIRLGLGDKQVAAAIRGMLKARDVHERARIVRAFDVSGWRGGYGDDVPPIGPADAKAATALLLEVSHDQSWEVRKEVTESLAEVFRERPQEAERVVPAVLGALNDADHRVRMSAPLALGQIAEASPQQGKAVALRLLKMVQENRGDAKTEVALALDRVGRKCAQASTFVVPALLELLQDKDAKLKTFASDSLTHVAPGLYEVSLANRHAKP